MNRQIIETKEFEVSFMGNTRPLVFSNGFKDEEIHAWKCDEDVLTLYFKDGKKYLLTYDPLRVQFIGDFHTGQITVSPVRNFAARFRDSLLVPRVKKVPKAEPKIEKVKDYAIISKLDLADKDIYRPKGRITPKVTELFIEGYEWVIFVQNGTKEDVEFFVNNLDETTVNYLYDGDRKDWMIGINQATFKSFGEFKPLQNFISNVKRKLEKNRKEPHIVRKTQNAQETN